jgi:hypothetical protein
MTKPHPAAKEAPAKERRRSPRVSLVIPVQLDWTTEAGGYVEVDALTETVSAHGALLVLKSESLPAREVRVRNVSTGAVEWAAVVAAVSEKRDRTKLAVTFSAPNAAFWGEGVPPPYSEVE